MNQIYVVVTQGDFLTGKPPHPIAAYLDYPSALTYAKSIFKPSMVISSENPRDLIFLLNVSPTVTTAPTTPTAPTATVAAK